MLHSILTRHLLRLCRWIQLRWIAQQITPISPSYSVRIALAALPVLPQTRSSGIRVDSMILNVAGRIRLGIREVTA